MDTSAASRWCELVDARVELLHEPRERDDVQHALTLAHDVDDVLAGPHQHRAGAVEHERRRREVLAEVVAEVLDRLARGLEREPGIQQALDHLQRDQVPVRVAPLAPAAGRVDQGRPQQIGAGPVVELAVRDPHDLADLRSAVAVLLAGEFAAGGREDTLLDPIREPSGAR